MIKSKIIFLLAIFALSGCARDNGRYAMISNNPVSLYTLAQKGQTIAHNATATSSRHVIVFIPLSRAPTIDTALEEVLKRYQGDYLTNVEITHRSGQLLALYHYSAWEITGDVVKIKR